MIAYEQIRVSVNAWDVVDFNFKYNNIAPTRLQFHTKYQFDINLSKEIKSSSVITEYHL